MSKSVPIVLLSALIHSKNDGTLVRKVMMNMNTTTSEWEKLEGCSKDELII